RHANFPGVAMTAAEEVLARYTPQTAWQPFAPTVDYPWTIAKVGHLYRRAAFGAGWQQLQDGAKASAGDLGHRLLSSGAEDAAVRALEARYATLRPRIPEGDSVSESRALWVYRILNSPQPARERMTLFWHNHFATSNAKVRSARMMAGQLDTLRAN